MNFSKLLFAFLCGLFLITVTFAGISINNYTMTKSVFSPGDPGIITISITNPTTSDRVSSITMGIDSPSQLTVTTAPKLADISSGGSAIVAFPIKIAQDAKPGIYTLVVSFNGFTAASSGAGSVPSINTVSIPIVVLSSPQLSGSVDNSLLNGVNDVVLSIKNDGGIASNVKLRISGTISLYNADKTFVGDIVKSKSIPLKLDSRKATEGPTTMIIFIDYDDELGLSHTDNLTLTMNIRNEKLDLSFQQNSTIFTKKENQLILNVKNSGSEFIKDLRATFNSQNLKFKDKNEIKFGDLYPSQSSSGSAIVVADLPPGINAVSAELSWIEKDIQKTETRSIPIVITSDAEVGVYLEAKPTPLTIGQEHTISVLVSNLGSYPIDNVDVSFSSDSMKSLDILNSQYIGNLNNDDFSTVQFKLRVKEIDEGTYPVNINVTYRDKSGAWISKNIVRDVNIYKPQQKGENPFAIVLMLAITAVLVWHFFFRKKVSK